MCCLVSSATLPESSSLHGYPWAIHIGAVGILMLGDAIAPAVMKSGRAASEEDDESAEEQADHRNEDGPNGGGVLRMSARSIAVNLVPDNAPGDEISHHDDQSDDPADGSNEGSEDGTAPASTESEEEGDEGDTGGDGVEDLDAGEAVSGILSSCAVVVDAIDGFHD